MARGLRASGAGLGSARRYRRHALRGAQRRRLIRRRRSAPRERGHSHREQRQRVSTDPAQRGMERDVRSSGPRTGRLGRVRRESDRDAQRRRLIQRGGDYLQKRRDCHRSQRQRVPADAPGRQVERGVRAATSGESSAGPERLLRGAHARRERQLPIERPAVHQRTHVAGPEREHLCLDGESQRRMVERVRARGGREGSPRDQRHTDQCDSTGGRQVRSGRRGAGVRCEARSRERQRIPVGIRGSNRPLDRDLRTFAGRGFTGLQRTHGDLGAAGGRIVLPRHERGQDRQRARVADR